MNINNCDRCQIDNPDWDGATKVHEWRNHVPDELKKMWFELSTEARVVLYYMAEKLASAEEWD